MQRSLVLLVLTGLFATAEAQTFTAPPFPRLASLWTGNQVYQNAATQQALAHGTIAVINVWPGWQSSSGMSVQQVITNIKAINPNTLVFNYMINSEIAQEPANPSASVWGPVYKKIDAMNWWLYVNGTSGTHAFSWPGTWGVNNTLFTPTDSNGDNWVTWFDKWTVSTFSAPTPALDGFYEDNVTWLPLVNADWNRDGTTDLTTNPQAQQWVRQGDALHFDTMHKLMPGKFQLGNISNWGDPSSVLTEFQGKVDGGFMEGLLGRTWSPEVWGGWSTMMKYYRRSMANLSGPQLGMFSAVGSPTDYQGFRYGFASCLMDNGYFVYNSDGNYTDTPLFDEYNAVLGNAVTAPPTAPWQNGVYRRDFTNGIALVNPKGNGAVQVTLETNFRRLSGTQAPAINSGQTVLTLTLQDRDGIILMRTTPVAAPAPAIPAPPASVVVH